MNDDFKIKSLKLLADPTKLREKKGIHKVDKFKDEIECKFNYRLNNISNKIPKKARLIGRFSV